MEAHRAGCYCFTSGSCRDEHTYQFRIMARTAALYRVKGPSGVYYAVYVASEQLLFTEANEKGARDHAAELGLALETEQPIRHAELMRLTGRDAPAKSTAQVARPAPQPTVEKAKPLEVRLPANVRNLATDVLTTKNTSIGNPFASSQPLTDAELPDQREESDRIELKTSELISQDVVSSTPANIFAKRHNPFAKSRKEK